MRILLTGASGFLGSHIAEQLDQQGAEVRALVRPTSDTRFLDGLEHVTLVTGAMSDKDSLLAATEGVDGIIHAAGLVKAKEPADFYATNEQGTANLLDAAKRNAPDIARFVLGSSLTVMGPSQDGRPVSAGASPNPVTHYGRSKLAAERAARAEAHSLPITIIRPPMIYGPRDREILPFFKSVQLGVLPLTPGVLLPGISIPGVSPTSAAAEPRARDPPHPRAPPAVRRQAGRLGGAPCRQCCCLCGPPLRCVPIAAEVQCA